MPLKLSSSAIKKIAPLKKQVFKDLLAVTAILNTHPYDPLTKMATILADLSESYDPTQPASPYAIFTFSKMPFSDATNLDIAYSDIVLINDDNPIIFEENLTFFLKVSDMLYQQHLEFSQKTKKSSNDYTMRFVNNSYALYEDLIQQLQTNPAIYDELANYNNINYVFPWDTLTQSTLAFNQIPYLKAYIQKIAPEYPAGSLPVVLSFLGLIIQNDDNFLMAQLTKKGTPSDND